MWKIAAGPLAMRVLVFHRDVEGLWKGCEIGAGSDLFHGGCLKPVLNVDNSVENVQNSAPNPQDMGFFSAFIRVFRLDFGVYSG